MNPNTIQQNIPENTQVNNIQNMNIQPPQIPVVQNIPNEVTSLNPQGIKQENMPITQINSQPVNLSQPIQNVPSVDPNQMMQNQNSVPIQNINLDPNMVNPNLTMNQNIPYPTQNIQNVNQIPNYQNINIDPNAQNVNQIPNYQEINPNIQNINPAPNFQSMDPNIQNYNQVPNIQNINPVPNYNVVNPNPDYSGVNPNMNPNINPGLNNFQNIPSEPYKPQGTYQPPYIPNQPNPNQQIVIVNEEGKKEEDAAAECCMVVWCIYLFSCCVAISETN